MMTLNEIIDAAEVGQSIDISAHDKVFATVEFFYERDCGYSYRCRPDKYRYRGVYPMRTTEEIKYWKTLDGAKRNFLKWRTR